MNTRLSWLPHTTEAQFALPQICATERSNEAIVIASGTVEVKGLKAVTAAMQGSAEGPVDIHLGAIRCPSLLYFGSVEPWADRARTVRCEPPRGTRQESESKWPPIEPYKLARASSINVRHCHALDKR